MATTVKIDTKNKKVIIEMDAELVNPEKSSTGATFMLASTNGAFITEHKVLDQQVKVNCMVYIKNKDYVKPAKS